MNEQQLDALLFRIFELPIRRLEQVPGLAGNHLDVLAAETQ